MLKMITKPNKSRGDLKASSLDPLIAKLKARRKAAHDKILSLEADGVKIGKPGGVDIEIRALALLSDDRPDEFQPATSLVDLYQERAVLDRALELVGARKTDEVSKNFAAEVLRRRGEYDGLIVDVVMTIVALRRAIKARDEFLEPLRAGIGRGTLPCAQPMPQATMVGGDLYKFLSDAVRAGIVTPKEIET
jgi:hypothetical protein